MSQQRGGGRVTRGERLPPELEKEPCGPRGKKRERQEFLAPDREAAHAAFELVFGGSGDCLEGPQGEAFLPPHGKGEGIFETEGSDVIQRGVLKVR